MRSATRAQWLFGVYAAIRRAGQVLSVRKARGPYEGLLDLPGGTPLRDRVEEIEATLVRELLDECGARLTALGVWEPFDVLVTRDSRGDEILVRHTGLWCLAEVDYVLDKLPPREDVSEICWLDLAGWQHRRDLSAPLRAVLVTLTGVEDEHEPTEPGLRPATR